LKPLDEGGYTSSCYACLVGVDVSMEASPTVPQCYLCTSMHTVSQCYMHTVRAPVARQWPHHHVMTSSQLQASAAKMKKFTGCQLEWALHTERFSFYWMKRYFCYACLVWVYASMKQDRLHSGTLVQEHNQCMH